MGLRRRCSRPSCHRHAEATLTYVYADSTAVLGPLSAVAEPHSYDLCQVHAERLTAPRGWEIIRIEPDPTITGPSEDDLEALANAVREAGRPRPAPAIADPLPMDEADLAGAVGEGIRRGHLRSLPQSEA